MAVSTGNEYLWGFVHWAERNPYNSLNSVHWDEIKKMVAAFNLVNLTDAGTGVAITCNMQSTELVASTALENHDVVYAKVKADDHVDPWSPPEDTGVWIIDEDAPQVSTVIPTLAQITVEQDYSVNVKAQTYKTISSCDLLVNGAKVDDMTLTIGTPADGMWTGEYTIAVPSTIFMRAHCVDDIGNEGDGVDVRILVETEITNTVEPSAVEKVEPVNITAHYKVKGGNDITGGQCWISSSDFDDPDTGILGVNLHDLSNGYYTYSFDAPTVSGFYNYEVSCAKTGYQIVSTSNSFEVLGCDGSVCIKVSPEQTIAILTLGETEIVDLLLKNRGDETKTYEVLLSSVDPKVLIEIAPTFVSLANGEEKTVSVQVTSVVIDDQQITQTIVVKNTINELDAATSTVKISIAISSIPGIGVLGVVLIFILAALAVYTRSGGKVNLNRLARS